LDGGLLRVLVDDDRYHGSEAVFSEYGNTLKSTMSLRRRNSAPGVVVSIDSTTVVMMTDILFPLNRISVGPHVQV
jgi:hypothetical protein